MNTVDVKNVLAKGLGGLWILDGLLQFQPQMFGVNFVNSVLVPNLSSQPSLVHGVVALGIYLWNLNPIVANTLAGLLQIAIGVLLLLPLTDWRFKAGLYISIVWGMVVWLCGEGAGLLFTGNASFYTGAPGAVLFYVLPAVFLLVKKDIPLSWLSRAVGWTLLLGSALQLQKIFWTGDGIVSTIMAPMMERFDFVKVLPASALSMLSPHPVISNTFLVLIPLVIGLAILLRPSRGTAIAAFVFLFFVWWWGQDFGMLTTVLHGTSTDPNTAPLLALLLVPLALAPKQQERTAFSFPDIPRYLVPAFVTADLSADDKDRLLRVLIIAVVVLGVYSMSASMAGMHSQAMTAHAAQAM